MIFVDTDFFIGLYLVNDFHHQNCLELTNKVKEELITSYDVVDEVTTKLAYFNRKDLALMFIKDLKKNDILIIYSTPKLFSKAIDIFSLQKIKHVSLTDCMNMAIAQEKKTNYFLSFDKIYEKNKLKLVK